MIDVYLFVLGFVCLLFIIVLVMIRIRIRVTFTLTFRMGLSISHLKMACQIDISNSHVQLIFYFWLSMDIHGIGGPPWISMGFPPIETWNQFWVSLRQVPKKVFGALDPRKLCFYTPGVTKITFSTQWQKPHQVFQNMSPKSRNEL